MPVSDQQRLFAQDIALYLKIPEPDVADVPDFIEEYAGKYRFERRVENLKRMIKMPGSNYRFFYDFYGGSAGIAYLEEELSGCSGVYAFVDMEYKTPVYIGKSKDLCQRIPQSFGERLRNKPEDCVKSVVIKYFLTREANISALEMCLIAENKPILNIDGNSNGKITMFKSNLDILRDFKSIPKTEEEYNKMKKG